jgi:hypothetical protein
MNSLKRNPDNQMFLNLVSLLEFKLDVIKDQLVRCDDDAETKRLQGRARELAEILAGLKRKPVAEQEYTGSFS